MKLAKRRRHKPRKMLRKSPESAEKPDPATHSAKARAGAVMAAAREAPTHTALGAEATGKDASPTKGASQLPPGTDPAQDG